MNDSFLSNRRSLANEAPLDVLRLIRSENVGPVTFFNLVEYFGSVKTALESVPDMARRGGRKKPVTICSKSEAEKEIELTTRFGAKLMIFGDSSYPALLTTIYDPPPVLSMLGYAHLWQKKTPVAIVGARNASASGCQFATKLAHELGEKEVVIVSGLARGIDTAAHKGALASGTVGVIAGGIDNIYPPENKPLFEAIAASGAIISEQPFGALPHAQSFPSRNRIISGMSQGIVVVEASFKSGSLITARFAAEQGREVFAVPGSPMDPRCKGTNALIRDGAILTESAEDVLSGLTSSRRHPLREGKIPAFTYASGPRPAEDELKEARKMILEKLGMTPVSVDELLKQCQLSPPIALPILLELELAGRLIRHPGNRVSLKTMEVTDAQLLA